MPPFFCLHAGINPYADPAQRQHFLDGLRKAGLPEA